MKLRLTNVGLCEGTEYISSSRHVCGVCVLSLPVVVVVVKVIVVLANTKIK